MKTSIQKKVLSVVLLPTGVALMAGCTDTKDSPENDQSQPNADGKYNIIFITTDQEAYMEQYPAGSNYTT